MPDWSPEEDNELAALFYDSGQWIMFPRLLRKICGDGDVALFLAELLSVEGWAHNEGKMRDGDWFYCRLDTIKIRWGWEDSKQTRILKRLEQLDLIERRRIGVPPKRYFCINHERLQKLALREHRKTKNSRKEYPWDRNGNSDS